MARPRKYTNSSVISFRISDEELERLDRMVDVLRVPRSDIMRLVLGEVVGSAGEKRCHRPLHSTGTP